MPISSDFPTSPHAILDPSVRWTPDDTGKATMPLPPLVRELRRRVKEFRDTGYEGATDTSKALLNWWFNEQHFTEFQYFFAQREAMETIVYLYDASGMRDHYDLLRLDKSGRVSAIMFYETWKRYVIKMATGTGKTKVLALALAWAFFHKTYEENSNLARNFLLIAPNIIVLDRIRKDFDGLRIFHSDPILPHNGFEGRNWRDDFQLTVHIQDDVRAIRPTGNIFLTNIHRVYVGNEALPPSPDDDNTMNYFLGKKPTGATTDSKTDLGLIVRDIDELMVLNDEAHHIHDEKMAWFKSIEDIHHRLVQKGSGLSLQLDVTATPKNNDGTIFPQTVADYPLVEAIQQNTVKRPVLPDAESRNKLGERPSSRFIEKYSDYLNLGVVEWRRAAAEHQKMGKKAILFVMTDDTRNCDEVAEYLRTSCPDLTDSVLVIHTKNNGAISEASTGKNKAELDELRKQANEIDEALNPYKAVVSVLMLKEGWDVKNVTTIVGLRPYQAKSNILPEQTLGRGLRKMYSSQEVEELSVIGTDAFMDFVESIRKEGVELDYKKMSLEDSEQTQLWIEVDRDNPEKDIDALDITIPVLSPRSHRNYSKIHDLDISTLEYTPLKYKEFGEEELREIAFADIVTDEESHTTELPGMVITDYRNVIRSLAKKIIEDTKSLGGYGVLYGKMKAFAQDMLFGQRVNLEERNTLKNLCEPVAIRTLHEIFTKGINTLTIEENNTPKIKGFLKLKEAKPFPVSPREYRTPTKSLFNRIVSDRSMLELKFADFLEKCDEVVAYAKNSYKVDFKIDYVNEAGNIARYYPDFIVKLGDGRVFIAETKGRADSDDERKMHRLKQWCSDVNQAQQDTVFDFVYVEEKPFYDLRPRTFTQLVEAFTEYKT